MTLQYYIVLHTVVICSMTANNARGVCFIPCNYYHYVKIKCKSECFRLKNPVSKVQRDMRSRPWARHNRIGAWPLRLVLVPIELTAHV